MARSTMRESVARWYRIAADGGEHDRRRDESGLNRRGREEEMTAVLGETRSNLPADQSAERE